MTAAFTVEGDDELIAKLNALWPRFSNAAVSGCMDWADDVMNTSKRLVPVDTGALKGSGYTKVMSGPDGVEITLGYSQNYALYVHENMEAHHENGQAKYLEIPLLMKCNELLRRMYQEMMHAAEEA